MKDLQTKMPLERKAGGKKAVPTGCAHNCGGRCPLTAYVRDGRVVRVEADAREGVNEQERIKACLRGRSYRRFLYHPARLKSPLKRTGKRGSGQFVEISAQQAVEEIAAKTLAIKNRYGNRALYVNYGSGFSGTLSGIHSLRRMLSLIGGNLDYYLDYSEAQAKVGTPYTVGTYATAPGLEDLFNTRLFILWGWNPAETIFGSQTNYYLRRFREKGARFIVIDPRFTDTAAVFADWHIPLKPGSDCALIDALAYVIFTEKLEQASFLERYCSGFDENSMPPGFPSGQSYRSWVTGAADGIARTPQWAEKITGVPAEDIVCLAREYAACRPAALIMGYGPQRHARGEHPHRGLIQLAALTGNIGVPGGGAMIAGADERVPRMPALPPADHDHERAMIPCFTWSEAVIRGHEFTAADGLVGPERLTSDIKLIYSFQSNALTNQHADINQTARILQDEQRCEYIVSCDLFMTPSTAYADIILPACSCFEKNDILSPWGWGDYLVFNNQVVEPLDGCRTDFQWCTSIAEEMGVGSRFAAGKSELQWLETLYEKARERYIALPSFAAFRRQGIVQIKEKQAHVPFREQVAGSENKPFATPSGKLEFFSSALYRLGRPDEIPAVARYVSYPEGPEDELRAVFPLQCITCHAKHRANSTFAGVDWLEEIESQTVWINPLDAAARGIKDGDSVKVYNRRGETILPAKVTIRIMPGVVNISQGSWYRAPVVGDPDRGGNPNVLTAYTPTPLAKGNPQHTNLVEVERVE